MMESRACPRCRRPVLGVLCASRFGSRRTGVAWRCACGYSWRVDGRIVHEAQAPVVRAPQPAAAISAPPPKPPADPVYQFPAEAPACPTCGAKSRVTSTRMQERPPFRWRKCKDCGATFKQVASAG